MDYKGRIIQQHSQNHVGGIDRMDYQYRFNNEVLKMRMTHRKTEAKDLIELYEYSYDHVGRKTSFTHNSQVVAKYEYDGIGRLQNKKFRPVGTTQGSKQTGIWTDASSWLSGVFPLSNDNVTINTGHTLTIPAGQIASAGILNHKGTLRNFGTLNMGKVPTADLYVESLSYHIRGGLLGKNLDANGDLTNSLFSFKLAYEEGTDGYFDGNIRNQYWKSNIDGIKRAYEYSYDGASRITKGNYGSEKAGESYALNGVTYDFDGNIKTLSRNGFKSNNSFGLVDNLNYTYNANSNKIQKVDDLSNEIASFADATGTTDYTYSLDGSLTSDANKGITVIEYNYLKLPRRVVQNGVTTLYQYDASGKKLKETIGTNFTDYSGNKIYKNNQLYQIGHDEGRIIAGEYEFNIKDHLGNLRVAFRDSLGVAKITQSYAYGIWGEDLTTLSYVKQAWKADNFKFTGKESLQGTGFIDFGARWYDNIVPRFTTIDPLSELSRRFSPTVYANGNPLRFIDPDGMQAQTIYDFNGKAHTIGDDEQTSVYQVSGGNNEKKDDFIFNENGDYVRTEKNNSPHRLIVENSQTKSRNSYQFADPVHDPQQISLGIIRRLITVSLSEVKEIMSGQGGFEPDNGDILSFILNSVGGGKFDYIYSVLKSTYQGVSEDPTNIESSVIFLPQGDYTVHNASNFGNFLLGATAHALGFGFSATQMGAHANSILFSRRNGYSSQFDSVDDQRSISLGVYYSIKNNFRRIVEQNK